MFQRPQSALALRARALLLVFEKFTRAYLFQIALEIMWLPILTPAKAVYNVCRLPLVQKVACKLNFWLLYKPSKK